MTSTGVEEVSGSSEPIGKTINFSVGTLVADALRYWEPRRIVYNALLALIVLGYFFAAWPASRSWLSLNGILWLFFLTVLANVAYCAAYVVDVFVQLPPLRGTWTQVRCVLFFVGLAFAGGNHAVRRAADVHALRRRLKRDERRAAMRRVFLRAAPDGPSGT
ncbi:MAG: hypothetical protein DMH00_12360 [Acidobacteria bacterium]|nr:MAG: hypothetical protein DMH00_12360 [Acidobacteriota bacterium]